MFALVQWHQMQKNSAIAEFSPYTNAKNLQSEQQYLKEKINSSYHIHH